MALLSNFAGKPILLQAKSNASPVILQGLASAFTELSNAIFGKEKVWGFAKPGSPDMALEVDSISEIEISQSADVPSHFVESGQLLAYNKIRQPQVVSLEVLIGNGGSSWKLGSSLPRYEALDWFERKINSTETFDIIMPERKYYNCTLTKYAIRRDSRTGPSLLVIRCEFTEILDMEELKSSSLDEQDGQSTQNAADSSDVPSTEAATVAPSVV